MPINLSRCKKAELTDINTDEIVIAGVSASQLDNIMIAAPPKHKFSLGTPMDIRFLDPTMGVVTCRCKLGSPLLTKDKKFVAYRCQVLAQVSRKQRRQDVKIPTNAQVRITHPASMKEGPGIVHNISAGGVYLGTPLAAQKGETLTFGFPLEGSVLYLTALVLRTESRPNLGGYGYGCKFVDLTPATESMLRGFVFQEERRLYAQKDED